MRLKPPTRAQQSFLMEIGAERRKGNLQKNAAIIKEVWLFMQHIWTEIFKAVWVPHLAGACAFQVQAVGEV